MLRLVEVKARMRRGRTAIYGDAAAGLLTPAVKLGARTVAWPAPEIDAILVARVAGQSDDDIRRLVKRLVAERALRLAAILPATATTTASAAVQ